MSALAAPTVAGPRPPDLLGTLSLRRNETISGLIHRIYGSYSNKNFRAIILANPQIEDPDRVEAGHPIRFPAIPAAVAPSNKGAWWVKITEKNSLAEALDLLRNYPESAPAARLIPYWNSGSGIRFAVILKQPFASAEAAQSQQGRLGPDKPRQSPHANCGIARGTPVWRRRIACQGASPTLPSICTFRVPRS